jgi:hypothetical protein
MSFRGFSLDFFKSLTTREFAEVATAVIAEVTGSARQRQHAERHRQQHDGMNWRMFGVVMANAVAAITPLTHHVTTHSTPYLASM